MRKSWVLLALITVAGLAAAQQTSTKLPNAPGAKVVALNRRPGPFSEPSIAVNPQNPRQVIAAFQAPASVVYSENAGESWQLAQGTSPENYKMSGHVSVTYDVLGHAILCYTAFDKLGTHLYWAHGAAHNGVFVRRSLDGGKTWDANAAPIDEQTTHPEIPFEDKPYLLADNNRNSPYAGRLYVGWTEFSATKSVILFSRSNDGGITWSLPFEISSHEGLPRDDNGAVEGFAATAAPNGLLYAVWSDNGAVVLAVSRDGGITFTPSRKILDGGPANFHLQGVEQSNGFPRIAVDPRSGRLFLIWSDYRNGDVDVFCSTSNDRGREWTRPVRVNNDPLHNGADQFLPSLSVDPSDGSAYVVFYDRRGDANNQRAAVVLARSTDGGQSFANYAWTDKPFDPAGQFVGNYTGLTALEGRIYGVWTETGGLSPSRNRAAQFTIVKVGIADMHPPVPTPR